MKYNSLILTNLCGITDEGLTREDILDNKNFWENMDTSEKCFPVVARYGMKPICSETYKYGVFVGNEISMDEVLKLIKSGRIHKSASQIINSVEMGASLCIPALDKHNEPGNKKLTLHTVAPDTGIIVPNKADFMDAHDEVLEMLWEDTEIEIKKMYKPTAMQEAFEKLGIYK
jgi:hypothetical protein